MSRDNEEPKLFALFKISACQNTVLPYDSIGFVIEPRLVGSVVSVFSPLASAEACEKSSRWLWKESCVRTDVRKPGNTMCHRPP